MEEKENVVNKVASSLIDEKTDFKDLINQLINELRNDIEVYEQIKMLNLTVKDVRENIAKLTEFKDDYNYCKNCPGINKCNKNIPHIRIRLSKEGNYISSSFEPCEKIVEKIAMDNKYVVADFPDEWKESSLRTLDLTPARKLAIKEFAKIFNNESNRWIYLYGNHKTGKTFTLVTFVNEYVRANKGKAAVINFVNVVKDLADLSYSDKTEFSRRMVMLSDVDLLLIDNFGAEYKNEYIRDLIVIPLLNERERNNKLTFFTSEFSLDEIKTLYSIGKNAGELRGRQLANLLKTMCEKEFDFNGASIYR